ncbi:NUDIX domain-containing protein [uncultured Anaerococcus sp.]|uniref:NUDIX hydrolase n=1 Tax=uncultured Anaerococcus sp. TaxID=293428 RepID=UPI00262D764D|nr:NUDIX domain-containing protein [uncultured Anaerococcus sp.]
MEILDLYDENRIRTGKTYIRGEKMPENTYRLIVHAAIFNAKGQLLIQQRQATKTMANLWDLSCGGASDKGESSKEAIRREVMEELGLDIDFFDIRPIFTANFKHGFDDFYLVHRDFSLSDLTLQTSEVQDARWASEDLVMKLIDEGKFVKYKKNFVRLIFDLGKDDRIVEI